MSRPRLIPVLLLKHGLLVRSQWFRIHQVIGNPVSTIERFSHWNVDELVLLDISDDDVHDLRRDDLEVRFSGNTALDVLRTVAPACMMPLAFGGRIRTVEDMRLRLEAGADKCVVNTAAVEDPAFITESAERFGSQCVVVSIDAMRHDDGRLEVMSTRGTKTTGRDPAEWAREAEERGAGEIFLNSVDRDGTARGYDIDLVRRVADATSIPVIACGGVGNYQHVPAGITEAGASAVAAANIFHFFELSYPHAKQACIDAGIPMRPVHLGSRWFPREPRYDLAMRDERLAARLAAAREPLPSDSAPAASVRWCTRCVYPTVSAVALEFDDDGVCSGCRVGLAKDEIPASEWDRRLEILRDILERSRSGDGSRHDCVIPVSGGKDSYFQAHVIKNVLGFNPLLVTYNGNNWLPVGWRNMHRMKEAIGADHVIVSPGVDTLKALNRLGFTVMGDMNWHAHVGITTAPVAVAAQHGIPLVIWGEHGYLDMGGQFTFDDFPEMSHRDRFEHFARGYEWNYFVGLEGLTAADLITWRYPSDQRLFELDMKGLYLGNFVHWEANEHVKLVMERYGWEGSDEPFDRTYRTISNLDDMHENGVHDYLKYVKFGYGRCTDHVCKDIRAGLMSRDEGIELVRQYDHVKPRDLARWLDYTGMSEDEFDRIADTFRDPRVWWHEDGRWVKANMWDRATSAEPALKEAT
jgi:imidazoleglycerol phosphate synthase cyclase subunit